MPANDDEKPGQAPVDGLFYESSNGDRWYLSRDPASGSGAVRHVGNAPSGDHVSNLPIDSFLSSETDLSIKH
jgi:hypothetical protein